MQRFKNILVVYNGQVGDEATLGRATASAKRNAARSTVVEISQDLLMMHAKRVPSNFGGPTRPGNVVRMD